MTVNFNVLFPFECRIIDHVDCCVFYEALYDVLLIGVTQPRTVEGVVRDGGTGERAYTWQLRQLDERLRPSIDDSLLVPASNPPRSTQVHRGAPR